MDEFLLIMRHEDGSKIASPEQMQAWMKQTMDWISTIAAQNKFVGGTGLPMQDACVVKSNKMVTNGPFGDIKFGRRRWRKQSGLPWDALCYKGKEIQLK